MKTSILKTVFLLLLTFEGYSYHSQLHNRHSKGGFDYNDKHDVSGVEYRVNNISFGYLNFINSYHKKASALKIGYHYGNIGINFYKLEGYKQEFGIMPVYKMTYYNMEVEVGYVPAVYAKTVHLFTLVKRIKF